jgi:hypothetical protein
MKDRIVDNVINQFAIRSKKGVEKYGVTLERNDIDLLGWVQHLQEELMDAVLYVERIKDELQNQTKAGKPTEVFTSSVQELRRSAECPSSLHESGRASAAEEGGEREHYPTNSNSKVFGAFDPVC